MTTTHQPDAIMSPESFYLVGNSTSLPPAEKRRREAIDRILRKRFEEWQTQEPQERLRIRHPHDTKFSPFTDIIRSHERRDLTSNVSLELIRLLNAPNLQDGSLRSTSTALGWLNERRRYAVHVVDLFSNSQVQYCMPLIYLAQKPDASDEQLQDLTYHEVRPLLPPKSHQGVRLVRFPQTRLSFLSDDIFADLYPTDVNTLRKIVFNFRKRLSHGRGYYNSCLRPFFDDHGSFESDHSFSLSFPIIEFEQLDAFSNRKVLEKAISQFSGDAKTLPLTSQWKYLRQFDSAEDLSTPLRGGDPTESKSSVSSARGLNEYLFPSFETLSLDRKQSVIQQQQESNLGHPQQLLSVDCVWLIGFSKSKTIVLFRNSAAETGCEHKPMILKEDGQTIHMVHAIESIIRQDRAYAAYEPFLKSRLAYMQYHVRVNTFTEQLGLVQGLNDLVAELNAIIDILQTQISVLTSVIQFFGVDANSIISEVEQRGQRVAELEMILAQARDVQSLYFQLASTETARRQAILANDMKHETHQQLKLAKRGDTRNKAILSFTIITIIFLPLSFFTSYFGMNTSDLRTLNAGQALYWKVAGPCLVLVILIVCFIAFSARVSSFIRRTLAVLNSKPHSSSVRSSKLDEITSPLSYDMDPESQRQFTKSKKRS